MSVHSDAAQARVEEIRAMRRQIPNFVIPTSRGERKKLAPAASIPPDFIQRTAVAVKNSPALVRGGAIDPERARDLLSFAEAYKPLADEIEALASFIRHSITAAANEAGSDALTTYALASRLAKRPEHAELAPHVDDLRRILGRRRKAKTKEQPAPDGSAPAPTSPAPAPPVNPSEVVM
jgi:hypothetical protein